MKFNQIEKTVVLPFDFSELSCQALEKTVEMVGDDSLIRVVHVAEYPSAYEYGVSWATINRKMVIEQIKNSFEKKLKKITGMPNLEVTVLFGGNPGHEICNFAKDLDAELIVLPSHGRRGFERFLLGSVAEKVIRFAPCPVFVLKQEATSSEMQTHEARDTVPV